MESFIVGRGEGCRGVCRVRVGITRTILAGVLLSFINAISLPNQVYSGEGLDGALRIFHRNLLLTRTDLATQQAIGKNVRSFAGSVFRIASIPSEGYAPVDQFILTISEQAVQENWKSLSIDVWVGGKKSPVGYYFRYEALDSTGSRVPGGAFLAADADLAKMYLDALLGFSRR